METSTGTMHSSMAKDIISKHADILYGTTARDIGSKASQIKPERPVLHGFNGKFSSVGTLAMLPLKCRLLIRL